MPHDVTLLPPRVLPPTDEADNDRCRAAFNPIWPYVCAALRDVEGHTHVHFGQSSRWPRQPDFPPVPFDEEYDPMSVVSVCLS